MMNGMMGAGMGLWMLVVVAATVAVLVVAVLAGMWLIRQLRADRSDTEPATSNHTSSPDRRSVDVLRRRYAAGEIDDEEYEQRLSVLSQP